VPRAAGRPDAGAELALATQKFSPNAQIACGPTTVEARMHFPAEKVLDTSDGLKGAPHGISMVMWIIEGFLESEAY
jgi:hypothetical protein